MKKKQSSDPFALQVLSDEEKALEEAFERGEFEETIGADLEDTKQMLREAVKQYKHLHTSKPVTIRINQLDLIKVKARAKREQIPYQTLLSLLIHQFAEGKKDLKV